MRSHVLDIARESKWPARYTGRALRNEFLDEWREREEELQDNPGAIADFRRDEEAGDMRVVTVWASEAIDLIGESKAAGDIVREMAADAHRVLRSILELS